MNLFHLEDVPTTDDPESYFPKIPVGSSLLSPDARALWRGRGGTRGSFWVEPEVYEGEIFIRCDFAGPIPPWLAYQDEGIHGLVRYEVKDFEKFLLENGIAPGQPFRMEFRYSAGTDYSQSLFGEGWEAFDFAVVEVERWSAEKVLEAWENFLKP